jgi:hypothetical protein
MNRHRRTGASIRIPDAATRAPRARVPRAVAALAAALVLGCPLAARAHDPGLSALDVQVTPRRITVALTLAAADARLAERAGGSGLEQFALASIDLRLDDVRIAGAIESRVNEHDTGVRVVIGFDHRGGSRLAVRSDVPARLARGHRELVTVRGNTGAPLAQRMLDARAADVEVALDAAVVSAPSSGFLELGIGHILGGYDHLLFLAALLLGVRRLGSVVRIVTAFTVAHSLTLSLAVVGMVEVPAAVVEPLIAGSIVFVGIENLLRGPMDSRWKLTFAFGLIHGLGFAGALQALGVGSGVAVAWPLALFNLGVEAGQVAVAVLLWPLIRQVNARPTLRVRVAPACSLLVTVAGGYWIVERTLGW